ncbi:MAG: hypothetical protein ABI311_08720 [Gemmatimonadaceae bacterium]
MIAARWRSNGVEGVTSDSATTLRHLGENAELHVSSGRLSRGTGYGTASKGARRSLARVGAIMRLRQHNRYYVHASAVVDRKGFALIFVGESGSGKSTLAFALARLGWSMLGDDGVVLEPIGDTILAHAWRSHSLISASLSSAFPELRGREAEAITGDGRNRIPITTPHAKHARLGAMVFIRQGPNGLLRRCGESNALASLVRQSPWVLLGDAQSGLHFEALGCIARSVPSFEFVHGHNELLRIGEFFDSAA